MSSPLPCRNPENPERIPADEGLTARSKDDQAMLSFLRGIARATVKPQSGLFGLKFSVLKGMTISAVQPCSSITASACQIPSQSSFTFVARSNNPSRRTPFGLSWNLYPVRMLLKGSSTTSIRSSTSTVCP